MGTYAQDTVWKPGFPMLSWLNGGGDNQGVADIGRYAQLNFPTGLCIYDLNNDWIVSTADLLELFAQWGTDGPADFDESGAVGTGDLLILFVNWGQCP